jgi:hypothetical protein
MYNIYVCVYAHVSLIISVSFLFQGTVGSEQLIVRFSAIIWNFCLRFKTWGTFLLLLELTKYESLCRIDIYSTTH